MAALPLPKYGIDKLYLFPYYQNREHFKKATGEEAPPFDASRPPKHWFDPDALKSSKRSIVYDSAIVSNDRGVPLEGPGGAPMLDVLVISKVEAGSVNIPYNYTNEKGAEVPAVPVPLRALDPDEELFFDFGGVVAVRNKKLFGNTQVGFTAQDREILLAIARKLNVSLS